MSWQAIPTQKGEVEALGGRTRGERAPPLLFFHFLKSSQGGGCNFPRGKDVLKWWLSEKGL
jgi:hypothetical protein